MARAGDYAVPVWWDWQISAHLRLASLASLWLLIPLMNDGGPVAGAVMATRLGATVAQTTLNRSLGRTLPLDGRRAPIDWSLMILICVAGLGLGALREMGTASSAWWVVPPLAAFSGLQLRMALRCYRTHARHASSTGRHSEPIAAGM